MVRWGIIGLGRIAARFAGAVMARSDARIAAVCSRDPAKAEVFARPSGAQPFGSIDAMLRTELDIVYVASPNALHQDHAVACLEAGKAVLVEKPFATTAAEAEAIARAARTRGRFAMEAMWTRFLPAVVEAKRLADSGALGRLTGFQAHLSHARIYDPGWRLFDPALGGGGLLDLGIYPISLAIHFLGPPDEVAGLVIPAPNGVDRQASMSLRCGAAMASIACGLDAEGPNDAVIIGERGRIRLQRPLYGPAALIASPSAFAIRGPDAPDGQPTATAAGRSSAWRQMLRPLRGSRLRPLPFAGDGFAHQIDEAHRCLATGLAESPIMPLADSIAAIRIIDSVRPRRA